MEKSGLTAKKSIVIIGGGTGTHTLLRGLKKYADQVDIKVIVTMADSGGSTGRLRDEFGFLPVGDARSALAALAPEFEGEHDILRKLFLYRFNKGEGLNGHTFGNLFLVALTDILGSEAKAIAAAGHVLSTCGEVIPVTHDNVHLQAHYDNGVVALNEHEIDVRTQVEEGAVITKLCLSAPARVSERAREVLLNADLIVLGPGDIYTSILANCIVDGVADVLQRARAPLAYVSNLMSRSGQTNGMGTQEYLGEIKKYVGRFPNYMFVNTAPLHTHLVQHYESEHEYPVFHTYTGNECSVIAEDLLATDLIVPTKGDVLKRSLIRHDSDKLSRAIMQLV